MVPILLAIRPKWTLATLGLAALGLLALGCGVSSPPLNAEPVAAGARSAAETRTSPDLVHGLAVDGPEVGAEVGNRVPEFELGLADGSTITATDLLSSSRPTFLFFFATT